jgi:CO/xanthine dehydrogenase Mo-binding subunit
MARYVGANVERPEGRAKVTGKAMYVADLHVAGAWLGATVRADVPRGVLRGFDFAEGLEKLGVVIVGPDDVPGENVQALIVDDQPVLCGREVRHWGEPLLLVAAQDAGVLERALAAIRPRIDPLEPLLNMEMSREVFKSVSIKKGDVKAAFLGAERNGHVVLQGLYWTDSQEQLYIEPQGCIAWPPESDGSITVRGSLQCPHYVRKALARCMGVALEKARVVQMETGGGFGGKEEYPSVIACHAALLAKKCGRPVRMIYDRHEDLSVTPKRHPSRVRHRMVVARDGSLIAMDIDVLMDGGAYTTLSPVVLSRGCIHAAGPYRCEHVRVKGRVVATNHVPYGAFRGFGAPQTCFAVERMMDRAARELSMHPYELRRKNMLVPGDTTATGQKLVDSVGSAAVMDAIREKTGFDRHPWCRGGERDDADAKVRGLGMSFFFHGAGFTGSGEELLKGRVRVDVLPDGRVEVLAGSTEIGQGTNALFLSIAAETVGCGVEDVVIATPDTARVPDSGPTVASRTCMVVGGCLEQACRELSERVGGEARTPWRERARAFVRAGGDARVTVQYSSPKGLSWDDQRYRGDAYPVYGWAADVVEVEVDRDTLEVEIVKVWTAVDVGRAIQPQLVEGQIEGGTLQAVGWSHLEVVSTKDGRFEQDRLATCIIPTTLDTPRFDVTLVENPYAHGPFGAKGVGELPMDGGAAAVASAIDDALGGHVNHVPVTPESLIIGEQLAARGASA